MSNKSPTVSPHQGSPGAPAESMIPRTNSPGGRRSWTCQLYLYDAFAENKPEKYKCRLRLLASPCGAAESTLGATVASASYISETGDISYNSQMPATSSASDGPPDLIPVEVLMDQIWQKYDLDKDGCLNNIEIKNLVEDYTSQSVSEEYCQEFLESIDDDGDALIDRKELSKFIESGIKLSKESREKYSKRGEFHKIVVQFFDGVDEVRKKINATGGNSYKFWGSKLSINCDTIDAFKTGHVRVDIMRMIPAVKGAKKYHVFNKPFCIPVQIMQSNSQYAFAHEFNESSDAGTSCFSHKLRFLLCVKEEYYDDSLRQKQQHFDFSSKIYIDSIRIHNKLYEKGRICIHAQRVANVDIDKGDLDSKIFNPTSSINPTNVLSHENWMRWELGGSLSNPTDANCRPLSYEWTSNYFGNTGDKLNIFVSLFHIDPSNGFDQSIQYVGTGLLKLFMRQESFSPLKAEKFILENKLNVDHTTINHDVICTILYKTETLYQHDNTSFSNLDAMPSLTPLKFSDNLLAVENESNVSAKKGADDFVLNKEELHKSQPNSPTMPSMELGVIAMSPMHEIQSPKSPPIPNNALTISPQHHTQPHPSSPDGILLSPQQSSPFNPNTVGSTNGNQNVQIQNLIKENTELKEQHQESQNAIDKLQAKLKVLEEQIIEADTVINDKSKVIDTLKGAHLRLRRKLKSFNEMEKTLKVKETETVRLNAQMEAMEKTNRELLNRLEQVHKKKFGYAPKKSNYNNFEAGGGRGPSQSLQVLQLEQQLQQGRQQQAQMLLQQQHMQQQLLMQQKQQSYNANMNPGQQPKRKSAYQHIAYDGKPMLKKNSGSNYQGYLHHEDSKNQSAIDRNLQQRQQIRQHFGQSMPMYFNRDDHDANARMQSQSRRAKQFSNTIPYGNSPYISAVRDHDSSGSTVNKTWDQIENASY